MANGVRSPEPVGFWRTVAVPSTVARLLLDDFCNPDRPPTVQAKRMRSTTSSGVAKPDPKKYRKGPSFSELNDECSDTLQNLTRDSQH